MTAKATGEAHGYDAEPAVRLGKSVLGCLLEAPALWKERGRLDADDFVLANQQQIFSAMAFLHEHEYAADLASVLAQLGEAFDAGDLFAVVDGLCRRTSNPTSVSSANVRESGSSGTYMSRWRELQL